MVHSIALAVFWTCGVLLLYVYVGYPLIARMLAAAAPRPVARSGIRPVVSVLITAYNEEAGIGAKLDNVLALDYPSELLEIIVASDASSDRTDSIVESYVSRRVRLVRVEGRRGKTACQNAAVAEADGEIIVFTDATTRLDIGALLAMVQNFADASVGCVAGSLVYEAQSQSLTGQGGTAYWSYEIGLRRAESSLGSLVGVSGCLYAVRRSAYEPIPADLISDFVIALRIRERGLRTILEPAAICFEQTHDDARNELPMRVRVAIRSINALVQERRLLNVSRFGVFAWQLWSHKLLRYASPVLWITALAANALLVDRTPYGALIVAQLVILAAGVAGFLVQGNGLSLGILRKPYYFLLTNAASLIALIRYLRGERMVTWKPVR
jgi:cellulose synthase/poly-beta-1,6-N-acetylglucosamine synthase-like glycosyltransferase